MHTLIDNSQTITHWIYYHTTAKLYVLLWQHVWDTEKNLIYWLFWTWLPFASVKRYTIVMNDLCVLLQHVGEIISFWLLHLYWITKMIWKIFAPISFEKNPANIALKVFLRDIFTILNFFHFFGLNNNKVCFPVITLYTPCTFVSFYYVYRSIAFEQIN
jgi:hypothetical protein